MTDTIETTTSSDQDMHEPLIVVSSDCHVSPQLVDDLLPYCPKRYVDAFWQWMDESAERRAAGRKGFVFGGDENLDMIKKIHTWNLQTEGARDIHARIRDMDRDGVAGEIIFHGSAPFEPMPFLTSGIGVTLKDPELAAAGGHMYNQWLADFCSVEPERHVGLCQLPMWDIEASIKELEWAREHGLRGANLPSPRADLLGYEDPAWDPFWAACQDLGMTLASHGGGGAATPPVSGPMAMHIYMAESNAFNRVSPVVRLLFAGVFERFPGLKIVQTEQQGAWYGDVLKELDSRWEAFRVQIGEGFIGRPSDQLREHYFVGASFQSRFEAETAIAQGYTDNIIWGSDYPHPEGTYRFPEDPDDTPMTHLAMRNTYHGLPAEPVRKMLGENGVGVYGFDREALVKVAARINAPTLDELSRPLGDEERPSHWGFAFRESAWLT